MNEINEIMNTNAAALANADTESAYPAEIINPEKSELSAVEAVISGDISSNFDILAMDGEFSNREAYAVTRPDDDDDTISIGKAAKNAVLDLDKWIVYRFTKDGEDAVGIVIFTKDGKKYATSSAYFIREFLTLMMLSAKDKTKLERIKVIHKVSKAGMTYPLCTFA